MSKQVLVTGASSGMGAATSRLLTERGCRVIGVDRDLEGLAALQEAGYAESTKRVDLADGDSIRDQLDGLAVDALINVAGLGPDSGKPELIWAVNLLAPLRVAQAVKVLPGGSIINVASVTGELADDRHGALLTDPLRDGFLGEVLAVLGDDAMAYTYSKWAVLRETARLAVELAPDVRVNAVSPGIAATPMGDRSMQFTWTQKVAQRIPLGRLGEAREIACAIAFLVSDDASYVTGARLVVDGGYVASRRRGPT
jgi:NAD(P)-dependent dehydrogenase (short-subunit alcohol dehydrogenase family)